MKHFNLLKTTLLLCALIVGSLSGWADDVTLTAGTNGSTCTVNNQEGIKVGTSKSGGDMSITVPANTTKLILHAAAWKGVSGLSLNVSGATASPKSIALTADDGISNNSPFTLSGSESDFEFEISLSDIITETKIKFESSIAKRFVVWGASAVTSGGGKTLTASDLALTGAPIALNFDLYNNSSAQVINYTTSSTGAVTVSESDYVTTVVDENNKTITVTPKSLVTPSAQTITVSQAADNSYEAGAATFTVSIDDSTPIPTHTATFSVNGVTSSTDYEEGAVITFPSDPAAIDDKVFMGWVSSAIVGTTDDAPSFVSSATMGKTDVTFYAVFANKETSGGEVIKSYGFETISDADWTIDGPARAEGNAYTGSYSGKINTNNTYVTFNSKVKVKEFSFVLKRTSTNSNYNVYVETSPDKSTWTAAATYSMDDFGNGSYTSKTKTFDGNTELYVRFHCHNTTAVRYVDDITIKYDDVTTIYTNYCTSVVAASVARPVITLAANPFTFSTTATITCATNGADIKYSYDGENWSDYSAPLTITETKTIYAKAVLNSDESQIASVTATKNLVEPTVTIDATGITNTNVFAGTDAGSLSATVTYNYAPVEGAVVTWSGNNDEVATINASTGAVTLVGAGSVTFTATYAGNGDYSEKTESYNMTVIYDDPNAPGTINNPLTVADVNSGSYSGDNYVTGYIVGFFVSKDDDAANSGKTNLALSDTPDEKSGANTIAIQLPSGTLRTSWNIEDNNVIGYKVLVYGSVESYYTGKTGVKSTSEITAVSVPVSVSAAGWATYSSNYPLDFTGITALTAYTATGDGNVVKFNKVTGKVPANTGLLVKGETANVPVCASAEAVKNLLVGVTTETVKTANTVFVLMKGSKGIGFYKNTNAFTLRANSAYLPAEAVPTTDARAFIALDEETTGIADAKAVKEDAEGMFDLQGRKIAKPTKGLYIVNGKKVVVK